MIVQVEADILNVPGFLKDKPKVDGYIVARRVWNHSKMTVELSYYGFYDELQWAQDAAHEIGNGIVLAYKRKEE